MSAWFCFVFLASSVVFASTNLTWPLQQNYGVSATFGESRSDHYHAGIDLSTNGVTGLPVLAVADGTVYRMKIQKRGYGKALYIQHSDGKQSVYAHLESYSSELGLEQIYRARAEKLGTLYAGDIFVEPPIRVSQGQVVAYSGESGAGLPHLHLELRKNEVLAINPLSNGLRDPLDSVAPAFQAFYIYPLSSDSAVNGELDTREIRFRKGESKFVSDSTPVVRGDFAVAVSVYDATSRAYRRSPNKLTYWIDDQEVYALEFDQFSYSEPQGFGLLYDLGKPGPSYFEYPVWLSKLADFPLPFLKRSPPFSTRSLAPGEHRLRIVASDSNNNTSEAEVPFIVNDPPRFEFESVRADQTELVVAAKISDVNWTGSGSLTGEAEYSIDEGKSFQPITLTSLVPGNVPGALQFLYRIPVPSLNHSRTIVVRGRAFDAYEYSAYSFRKLKWSAATVTEVAEPFPAGEFRYETYRAGIRVIYEPQEAFHGRLEAAAGDPPRLIPLHTNKRTSLVADIPPPQQSGNYVVSLKGGQSVVVPVNFLRPLTSTPTMVVEKTARLTIPPKGVYGDAWIWTKSLPAYASKALPLIAPIVELGPRGLPLRRSGVLSFTYPAELTDPQKLSIYIWSRTSQSWRSLPSHVNQANQTIETKIDHLDLFALILDNVPPRISAIFPKPRSTTRNQFPVVAVHVRDEGMDVDDEKVTLFVDDAPYAAEYDPDRNVASAKVTRALAKGTHKFYAIAYDYAGNKFQSPAITFRVK